MVNDQEFSNGSYLGLSLEVTKKSAAVQQDSKLKVTSEAKARGVIFLLNTVCSASDAADLSWKKDTTVNCSLYLGQALSMVSAHFSMRGAHTSETRNYIRGSALVAFLFS